jgi:hypothetical protein
MTSTRRLRRSAGLAVLTGDIQEEISVRRRARRTRRSWLPSRRATRKSLRPACRRVRRRACSSLLVFYLRHSCSGFCPSDAEALRAKQKVRRSRVACDFAERVCRKPRRPGQRQPREAANNTHASVLSTSALLGADACASLDPLVYVRSPPGIDTFPIPTRARSAAISTLPPSCTAQIKQLSPASTAVAFS